MKKDILQDIIANKRIEVARQKQAVSLQTLLALGSDRMERDTRSMRAALESSPSGIIAEFKRKSPSKGWLHPGANIADVVPAYEAGGASACSILTDGDFFGGSLGDLQKARKLVDLPLLRKDFIIDTYQLFQARVIGADAVLLIAAALTEEECRVRNARLPEHPRSLRPSRQLDRPHLLRTLPALHRAKPDEAVDSGQWTIDS